MARDMQRLSSMVYAIPADAIPSQQQRSAIATKAPPASEQAIAGSSFTDDMPAPIDVTTTASKSGNNAMANIDTRGRPWWWFGGGSQQQQGQRSPARRQAVSSRSADAPRAPDASRTAYGRSNGSKVRADGQDDKDAPAQQPEEDVQQPDEDGQKAPLFESDEEREAMRRLISRKQPTTSQPERTFEEAAEWFKCVGVLVDTGCLTAVHLWCSGMQRKT